ncbi:hypothetical protein I546_4911 [Mycobacterium kansasii 732]|nr:hypothetical protein I546_4911 [Mycobacterium kansasii 732]
MVVPDAVRSTGETSGPRLMMMTTPTVPPAHRKPALPQLMEWARQ